MRLQPILSTLALGLATYGCLTPEELEPDGQLSRKGSTIETRQNKFQAWPVGQGDRFKGGNAKPTGLGEKATQLGPVFNVQEVDSALKGLQRAYPQKMRRSATQWKTFENRDIVLGTIGTAPRVFLTGGVHARERGGPDIILYFISDLLWADANNKGLTYGQNAYTPEQVKTALGAGLVFIPLVNPDGVAYDQRTDSCWRKNRNSTQSYGQDQRTKEISIGVDLNRNFGVFWDFKRLFNQRSAVRHTTSDDPSSPFYLGPSPESEAETRAVAGTLFGQKSLSWYLDLHSYGGQVLYAWGDAMSQTQDPQQSFTNPAYDGRRGLPQGGEEYKEYIEEADLEAQKSLSAKMAQAMNEAGLEKVYRAGEAATLYPAQGSSDDAMSRYYGKRCGANRIHGITLEFGRHSGHSPCPFYPDRALYHENVRQTAAGLMELLLRAADKDGEPKLFSDPKLCSKQPEPQKQPVSQKQPARKPPQQPQTPEGEDDEDSIRFVYEDDEDSIRFPPN